jgi:hypothetical protein
MGIVIFTLWFLRSMTISVDSPILRYGVPVALLSSIALFAIINRRTLPALFKTDAFRHYLFLLFTLVISVGVAYKNGLPIGSSISAMMRFLLMGGFLVLGFILTVYGKYKIALAIITLSMFIHLAVGVIGYFFGLGDEIHGVFRPTGLTGRVNILANLALFAVMFYGVRGVFENKHKPLLIGMMLLGLVMIFLSGTLKNVVALVGTIGFYTLLGSQRKLLTIFLLLILGLPTLYALTVYTPIGDRLTEAFIAGVDLDIEEGQKLESSLQWRILHWKLLIDDWLARYLYTGAGFGQVGNMNALKTSSGEGFVAHSDWIQFLVELGPILFIAFVYGHYKLLQPVYRAAKSGDAFALALFFAFISQCIAMLAGPVYFSVSFFYYFWILLGIYAAKDYLAKRKNET